jgi:nucleotide sugar dehydrogenase
MKFVIVGKGIVGDATGHMLEMRGHEVVYHDPPKGIAGTPDGADCALLCVPTPMGPQGYNERAQVFRSAQWLADEGFSGAVGIRSTVTMGTCDALQVAYAGMEWFAWPEFLRAAHAREDTLSPARSIIGTRDRAKLQPVLEAVGNEQTVVCSTRDAEFAKYATNAFHAMAVGLANELSPLAAAWGVDWNALMPQFSDKHIPANIVVTEEGGFGGACLPKDTAALLYHALHDRGISLPMLDAMHRANMDRRPEEYPTIC